MEIEYSTENKFSFSFNSWERKTIQKGMQQERKRLLLQLERTTNSPKNEGQAKFQKKIANIKSEIKFCEIVIENLNY